MQGRHKHKPKSGWGVCYIFFLVCIMYGLLYFCISDIFRILIAMLTLIQSVPSHSLSSNVIITRTNAMYETISSQSQSLKERMMTWIQSSASVPAATFTGVTPEAPPDFTLEHWTPISIDINSDDVLVTLCRLDFASYSAAPHLYPMFKDFVAKSQCNHRNIRQEKLSTLIEECKKDQDHVVAPTGFVFHESRVGSTLVANLLASNPYAMVFSESDPPANALLHCDGCSLHRNIQVFRDVITVMGHSPVHKYLFYKFQSITTTKIEIALKAFPFVPWIFIYRQPVQTMMSHLDPEKGGAGPCLRSRGGHPPQMVKDALVTHVGSTAGAPKEAWCAAHLNMLCLSALDAYKQYSQSVETNQIRGMLVNYEALPGLLPRVILPELFHVAVTPSWLVRMNEESTQYSKGRGSSRKSSFTGDSHDKDSRATDAIRKWGETILQPTYDTMQKHMHEAMSSLVSTVEDLSAYKAIPVPQVSAAARAQAAYSPPAILDPFSNIHNSTPFERVNCPLKPEPGYPKAYPIMNLINNWNPDDANIPAQHYDTLCHFDYQTEYDKAINYRDAEVPFVVYNVPEVNEIVAKWKDPDYLESRLGKTTRYRSETSEDNHFMYWRNSNKRSKYKDRDGNPWKPPTGNTKVTFAEWLKIAVTGQNVSLEERRHVYFRVSAMNTFGENKWLFDELKMFQPKKSFFIVDPDEQRGIHCRFGMKSIIAESHFDGSRNFAGCFGGMRRWILNHPKECGNMYLLPRNHPSGRHSEVDWSKPDLVKYPRFASLHANEIITKAGDMLYIPTDWFHYIISLTVNYQCNTRSGITHEYSSYIKKCGF